MIEDVITLTHSGRSSMSLNNFLGRLQDHEITELAQLVPKGAKDRYWKLLQIEAKHLRVSLVLSTKEC
ncbi:hypothetical protein Plhal304r1_c067g0155061 [Plasmopara halstedii]